MMKKLLVLMLVLGMSSLATAGYILEATGDPGVANIVGDGNFGAAFIATTGGTANIVLTYEGDMALLTEYAGVDPDIDALAEAILGAPATSLIFAEYGDAPDTGGNVIRPTGIITTVTGVDFPVTVTLLDGDFNVLGDSVTLVPEPMTLALLGLGGLFLRRRK